MKRVLVSGFEPFGGEKINPSWESVKLLNDTIGDYKVYKILIPTVFGKAFETVLTKAKEINPDVIICVGQAGGRKGVTLEVVGINLREANICDNEGNKPTNEPIIDGGETAYFSTLPIREMVKAINEKGIRSSLSFSAGAFVCNDLLYSLLNFYNKTDVKVGFIHVPFLPEQAGDKHPSLTKEEIKQALEIAISIL